MPVEEKAISRGQNSGLRCLFSLPAEEKALQSVGSFHARPLDSSAGVDGSARDSLFPTVCRGTCYFKAPPEDPGRPRKCLASLKPKTMIIANKLTIRLLLFWKGSNTAPGPGRSLEAPKGPWKPLGRSWGSSAGMLAMAFPPCLSSKRLFQGSPGKP